MSEWRELPEKYQVNPKYSYEISDDGMVRRYNRKTASYQDVKLVDSGSSMKIEIDYVDIEADKWKVKSVVVAKAMLEAFDKQVLEGVKKSHVEYLNGDYTDIRLNNVRWRRKYSVDSYEDYGFQRGYQKQFHDTGAQWEAIRRPVCIEKLMMDGTLFKLHYKSVADCIKDLGITREQFQYTKQTGKFSKKYGFRVVLEENV